MPQDALTYSFLVNELDLILKGSKIDKITMPFKDEIILSFRHRGKNFFLLISLGQYARLHLIKENKPSPPTPFSFCMHLRKNIGGGIIESISQEPFERIIYIDILFRNELGIQENKRLVLEIMGRYSNAILVNRETNKITDCAKHIAFDEGIKRVVMPGIIYKVPDNKSFNVINKQWFLNGDILIDERFRLENDLAQNLNIRGLAPITKQELVYKAKLDNSSTLKDNDRPALFNAYTALYNEELKPCILGNDFFIRPYNFNKGEYLIFDSLNETMDYFFANKDLNDRLKSKSSKYLTLIKNNLKRAAKKLTEFKQRMIECENLEEDKIFGELITANIYKLKQGDKELETINYYDNISVKIPLDVMLSPAKNAQKYYKKYAKKKRALEMTSDLILKTEDEITLYQAFKDDLDSVSSLADLTEIIESMADLKLIKEQKRTKKDTLSSIYTEDVDGFKIRVGKNNVQNDRLVRQANKDDLWFHIKNYSGSHVIIEAAKRQVPDNIILKAAQLAAKNSKAKALNKIEVDYTYIKYVHKISGTVLGKVSYTNQKTIVVNLD
ncbi:MAG: NFACT family protein [Firmicutes bacterium]|nr:NFACT family protein [Bacillota bacterium]